MFDVSLIEAHAERLKQPHLCEHLEELDHKTLEKLDEQLSFLDENFFFSLQQLQPSASVDSATLSPLCEISFSASAPCKEKGWEMIRSGKVGVLIAAGGQGTRLGFSGPKGIYPLSPVKGKSLFEMHMEKISALQELSGATVPVAIMTSPLNHEDTQLFFSEHNYFGLDANNVHFFQQTMLPLLTEEGKLFFSKRGEISYGPDGNGSAVKAFFESGIYDLWQEKGIGYVQFLPVDNPLALPVDPQMVGEAALRNLECVVKVVERLSKKESVGVMATREGRLCVVEYSEIAEELRDAQGESGDLLYRWANISVLCFSLPFLRKAYEHYDQMPLHIAHKKVLSYDPATEGQVERCVKKFERFIFDIFAFAEHVGVIASPRENSFAPLKGEDSVESARKALSDHEKGLFLSKYNVEVQEEAFECDPKLYFSLPS